LKNQGIIIACKGLCHETQQRFDELTAKELINQNVSVITGPSFAKEVAKQLPTAILVASKNTDYAVYVQQLFHSHTFRCYTSNDIVGAQIGAAVKNILAIACGISDGLGFGANARAGLITRGLKEIITFGSYHGGHLTTFNGLSGLGDLVLTCTDDQSRNRSFGLWLGKGKTQTEAINIIGQTVEGIKATKSVHILAQQINIDMPIVNTMFKILFEAYPIKQAVFELLSRESKPEYNN
jgi:glycerol-3-phosphate dehydrogenase (NAD(P)+)